VKAIQRDQSEPADFGAFELQHARAKTLLMVEMASADLAVANASTRVQTTEDVEANASPTGPDSCAPHSTA
jgi:hypothetical protein